MNDAVAQGEGAAGGVTAGELLRDARQATGMHIAALAVALKVPVSKLEALEANRLEMFPDAVFVRALASSVCRTLKVDAAPVLALLPQSRPPKLTTDKGLNAAFKSGSGPSAGPSPGGSGSRPVIIAVVVLLLAALGLIFVPRGAGMGEGGQDSPEADTATQEPVNDVQIQETPVTPVADPASAAGGEGLQRAVPAASVSAVQGALATASVASSPVVASEPAMAASAPDAGEGILVIRAHAESWVQVRSASGATVLQRNLAAGEQVAAVGTPPWSVVIGKADATEVVVRGKTMDLTAIARENVARFEVK